MSLVQVCDALGWDYHKYMSQPSWFIDMLVMKRQADEKYAEDRQKRAK